MTPKEKSEELILNFMRLQEPTYNCFHSKLAKQCALIAVDEILKQWEYIDTYLSDLGGKFNPNLKYWQEVKEELINK